MAEFKDGGVHYHYHFYGYGVPPQGAAPAGPQGPAPAAGPYGAPQVPPGAPFAPPFPPGFGPGAGAGAAGASAPGANTHPHPNADSLVKGLLVGAGAAYLLSNETAQRTILRTAVQAWALVQNAIGELKERLHDAEAEVAAEAAEATEETEAPAAEAARD